MKTVTRIAPVLTALLCSVCCAAAEPTSPASVPAPVAPATVTATADTAKAAVPAFPVLPVGYTRVARFSQNPPVPDHAPVPVHEVRPKYPDKLKASGEPGYAIVVLLVDQYGNPQEIQCTEASDRAFGRVAEKAVSAWGFFPAIKRQQAIPGKFALRFEFNDPTTIHAWPIPVPN